MFRLETPVGTVLSRQYCDHCRSETLHKRGECIHCGAKPAPKRQQRAIRSVWARSKPRAAPSGGFVCKACGRQRRDDQQVITRHATGICRGCWGARISAAREGGKMPKPKRITPETMALLEAEARRRAECLSNKELASMTGLSCKYVANLISELRRVIEGEREYFHVSCGTVSE